jgi:hypothetical protein
MQLQSVAIMLALRCPAHVDAALWQLNVPEAVRKGDLLHGKGQIEWPEGSSYEGDFLNGEIVGRAVLYSVDGSIYEGEFKTGMLYRQGVYRLKGMTSSGEFKDGYFRGSGDYVSMEEG